MYRYFVFLCFLLNSSVVYSQTNFLTSEPMIDGTRKKRITEILRRDNYGQIEPYFYVSNRPTLDEALSEEIRNRTLISPMNHMVYCPTGMDYFSDNRLNTGTVYISSQHLPKNGTTTERWFDDAYRYRNTADPLNKPANVAIISPKSQNFLRIQCPKTHNNIIVSTAALNPLNVSGSQKNIDTVRNLRYEQTPDINWSKKDYTLPSHMQKDYIEIEEERKAVLSTIDIDPPIKQIEMARDAASKHGVLLKFLLAIAEVASNYQSDATSKEDVNKEGIMQLSDTIQSLYGGRAEGRQNTIITDKESYDIAARYIKSLHFKYNTNIEDMLLAYYNNVEPNNERSKNIKTDAGYVFVQEVLRRIDRKQEIVFKNN